MVDIEFLDRTYAIFSYSTFSLSTLLFAFCLVETLRKANDIQNIKNSLLVHFISLYILSMGCALFRPVFYMDSNAWVMLVSDVFSFLENLTFRRAVTLLIAHTGIVAIIILLYNVLHASIFCYSQIETSKGRWLLYFEKIDFVWIHGLTVGIVLLAIIVPLEVSNFNSMDVVVDYSQDLMEIVPKKIDLVYKNGVPVRCT